MTAPVRPGPSPTSGGPAPYLSDRQIEVLHHAAAGLSIPETARTMRLAVGTVDYHQRVVVAALKARNIMNAVFLACQAGILDGKPRRHGDHPGYTAHLRAGEDPCDACREGERAYRAKQRATHKTKRKAA